MVTIKSPKIKEIEQVVGKSFIENIKTIRKAAEEVLKNNLDLRRTENRHIVRLLVEQKLKRRTADESVARVLRDIQNTDKLWLPEEDDKRFEKAEINREYYGR